MIIKLLKKCKEEYYANYFLENKSNVKETWKCIKNIINLNKRSECRINKIRTKQCYTDDEPKIAAEFNNFFSTIGK